MDFYSISLSNVTPVKLVTAKATYGIGFLTAFVGGFCSLFGIPNNMFTQKLKKAETLAMEELTVNAKAVGADGVMDVRCQIDGLSFLVCGTAYKRSPAERAKREAEERAKREAEENKKVYDTNKIQTQTTEMTSANTPIEKWNKAYLDQGRTVGVCEMCGKKKRPVVYAEFTDFFGTAEKTMCYDCFLKRDCIPKNRTRRYAKGNAPQKAQIFICPKCSNTVNYGDVSCSSCGQQFDWSKM